MISIYLHENGSSRRADKVDAAWLDPSSTTNVWVDLAAPTPDELRILTDDFHFHPLSVEDARSAMQFPKVETYPGYLYLVLHGIDLQVGYRHFATRDIDFFVSRNALVTVHDGNVAHMSHIRELCGRHERVMAEGPVALLHRIVDAMVDNYRPVMEELERRTDRLEEEAFVGREQLVRRAMKLKRELATMRRILTPQRDVLGRLGRREFDLISTEMAYRFRDVYDHVVRLTEEAILFQDRVTGIFEVHLSTVSNRLNQVMKVLTVMSTIFLPLTVLTGMWGMNIDLPRFPGGDAAQFW
ncbi:MAG: magnesium transporter CorA family protein, partial [Vicinamibacterales bacterium]